MNLKMSESNPRSRISNFISRITAWQRKNRGHVRRQLKKHQGERVNRNKASRLLKNSNRARKCVVCGSTASLEVAHKDNNTKKPGTRRIA